MTSYSEPSSPGAQTLLPDLSDAWPAALVMGLLTAAMGVVVMVWPRQTLTVLSVLLGIQLVVFGLFRLISAFSSRTTVPVLLGLVGLLGMGIGVVVLRHPFESISVLATLLGVVWIVGGSIDLIEAIVNGSSRGRLIASLGAAITIVAGIIVVAWPAPTLTVIAWTAGIYLIAIGLTICVGAFNLKWMQDGNPA
ncbi:MAG: HdeD family acid-resistance protein [Acidimicrobiales bacterium]